MKYIVWATDYGTVGGNFKTGLDLEEARKLAEQFGSTDSRTLAGQRQVYLLPMAEQYIPPQAEGHWEKLS